MTNTRLTIDELHRQLKLAVEHKRYHAADFFKPVPKQLEFIGTTLDKSESMLMAGNGCGKTETAAFIVKTWMTGEYPPWWNGYVFDRPVRIWVAGDSVKGAREGCQTKLLGVPGLDENLGSGMIPKEAIVGEPQSVRGVAGSIDNFQVRHKSGGISRCVIKTYSQERQDWQGADIDAIWFDEEPPAELHSEGQARRRGRGRSIMTFTPLKGMTNVVMRYLEEEDPSRAVVRMGLKDATWYTEEEFNNTVAAYLPHEREARINGDPLMGEGKVYLTPRSLLEHDPFPIDRVPKEWVKIWGIDFGIMGFAAVLLAWDRDRDHYYVLEAVKLADQLPLAHVAAMQAVAANVPVAWPSDGNSRDRMGAGEQISDIYKGHGLEMLKEHATHSTGGMAVYPGIREIDETMRTGRFHVDRRLLQWFSEYDQYHYKDNKIVKAHDHLMDATRYAWMMRRKAKDVELGSARIDRMRELANRPKRRPLTDPHTGRPVRVEAA